jgi:LDH2 family malate/lactate/ureidoglycolate dehydrogenase
MLAVDVGGLASAEAYRDAMDRMLHALVTCDPVDRCSPVSYPGRAEHEALALTAELGVGVDFDVYRSIVALGGSKIRPPALKDQTRPGGTAPACSEEAQS